MLIQLLACLSFLQISEPAEQTSRSRLCGQSCLSPGHFDSGCLWEAFSHHVGTRQAAAHPTRPVGAQAFTVKRMPLPPQMPFFS